MSNYENTNFEYSIINGNVTDLITLRIPITVQYVNLHCNTISRITNLSHLIHLKHLDLSSNKIKVITGLKSCRVLETLSLSSNLIEKVDGIEQLFSLEKLDLSFNKITNLVGLKSFRKSSHKLKTLHLFGNQIASVKDITENLSQCQCLEVLVLENSNDSNPVCKLPAYWPNVWAQLPWLKYLDGLAKDKCDIYVDDSSDNIPGLKEYIDLLAPSTTSLSNICSVDNSIKTSTKDFTSSDVDIETPKIDEALAKFRHLASNQDFNKPKSCAEHPYEDADEKQGEIENRIVTMEKTLSNFVKLYQTEQPLLTCSSESSTSEESALPVSNHSANTKKLAKNMNVQFERKKLNKKNFANKISHIPLKTSHAVTTNKKQMRSPEDDETYLALLNEIDGEKERRWKAEQAAKKLIESVKNLQERLIDEKKIQEAAISSSTKYKQDLDRERNARKEFETLAEQLKMDNESLVVEKEDLHLKLQSVEKEFEDIKKLSEELEKENAKENLHHKKMFHELQFSSAGAQRELSLLQNTTEKQKGQLVQLQELLVAREQEHKEKLAGMINRDGREVRQLLEKELATAEERNTQLIEQHKNSYQLKCEEYNELENEFRMALQIEANRFNELHAVYTDMRNDFHETKASIEVLSQRESKAKSLVTDLSSMVKEQKVRITELVKSKTEIHEQSRLRINSLESEVEKLRKASSKCEALEQDKERLAAHIRGQESIINGLRSERKLWGEELAQQGASLSRERGKLESLTESQRNEIVTLQEKIKDFQDSLKIKTKLIEDQTETIRTIKEELRLVAEKNKRLSDEECKEREFLENELNKYKDMNDKLQESCESLKERKEQLKDELSNVRKELSTSQDNYNVLSSKWEERSEIIDQLEGKVYKMKNVFDEKESILIREKEELLSRIKDSEINLNKLEEKHKQEKQQLFSEHQLNVRKIKYEAEKIQEQTKGEIAKVEDEMRVILKEKAEEKRKFEARISKLTKTFSEIQQEMSRS